MTAQTVLIGRRPPEGGVILRLRLTMTPLTEVLPAVADKTAAPVESDRQAMSLQPPKLVVIPRLFLFMARGTGRFGMAEITGRLAVRFEVEPADLLAMIPRPCNIMPHRLGRARPSVVVTTAALHPLLNGWMLEGRGFLATLVGKKKWDKKNQGQFLH